MTPGSNASYTHFVIVFFLFSYCLIAVFFGSSSRALEQICKQVVGDHEGITKKEIEMLDVKC